MIKSSTSYDSMIAMYSRGSYIQKIPYSVLKEVYDDLVTNLVDLKGLSKLIHTCEHLYINYKTVMPLSMRYHVVTYLLNAISDKKKDEYILYYHEIVEKLHYEANLQDYINS